MFDTMQHPSAQPIILVADDQVDVLEALRLLLKGAGYGVGRRRYDQAVHAVAHAVLLAVTIAGVRPVRGRPVDVGMFSSQA